MNYSTSLPGVRYTMQTVNSHKSTVSLLANKPRRSTDYRIKNPCCHRDMSPPPPELGKAVFWGQSLIFGGSSQQPKVKKIIILLYLLNEKKIEFIPSSVWWSARNPGFLLVIGWGESGKTILNEMLINSINSFSSLITCYLIMLVAVFFWHCQNIDSATLKNRLICVL